MSQDVKKMKEMGAIAIALSISIPLVSGLVFALKDGSVRAQEAPLRSMIGDARYEALSEGEGGFPHYLGYERVAPDFSLSERGGERWSLEAHRGKLLIVNFWSVTCGPCLEEMPSLETLAERVERRYDDVEVVAISTDESWEAIASVVPAAGHMTYLLDPEKRVSRELFGTELFPETWIIDEDGVVRMRYDGAFDWSSPLVLDVIESLRAH